MKDPEVDATTDPSISIKLSNYSVFQVKHEVDRMYNILPERPVVLPHFQF